MRLYVMRHGPAEDRAASGLDADRHLTTPGRDVVERAARRLREARGAASPRGAPSRAAPISQLLSSPLLRARETAEIVWRAVGDPATPFEVDDDLSTDAHAPVDLAMRLVAGGVDTVIVGHNPNVEDLVRQVAQPTSFAGFRTAMIVCLEVEAGGERAGPWRLVEVIDPHR